jgi:glycosyltransferase involved in cell wall biosynthesis
MPDVILITYNERLNLPHSLASLQGWAHQIFVVDSGSTDGTQDVARSFGATVVENPWPGYARQKNWALDNLPLTSEWVLILDADEIITPPLREQIVKVTSRPIAQVPENGFFINRLTYFLDQPIHHCGYYPSWNLRLFKRGRGRYEDRAVHEHVAISNPVGYIREPMLHQDRRGLEHYFAKHNRYSTLEAQQIYTDIRRGVGLDESANLTPTARTRRWLKRYLSHRIPFPAVWRFAYMYFLRLGFLDGLTGFQFCKFIATYDSMVALKLRHLLRANPLGTEDEAVNLPRSVLAVPEGQVGGDATLAALPVAVDAGADEGSVTIELPNPSAPKPALPSTRNVAITPDRSQPPGNWPQPGSVPVSILIPVKNERLNIVNCIRHCLFANQIAVIDSQSTDETIALSQALGAEVFQFQISPQGWPKKKNWALQHVPWKNDWVMIIDADEHITPELAREIEQVVTGKWQAPSPPKAGCGDGYWVNRRFMFMGRWIKGCGYYPSWNVRLFKHAAGRYERIGMLGDTSSGDNEVHEHVILATGPAGYLRHEFLHYAYPDLSTWIEKHNRYSTWEAHAMGAQAQGGVKPSLWGGPIERRRWLKAMGQRLPMRPALRFLYSYLFERGFLDGYPGFVMCRLIAWYEFVSIAKHREMKRRGQF